MDRSDIPRPRLLLVVGLICAVGIAAAAPQFISVSNNTDGAVLNQPGGPSATVTGNFDAYTQSGDVSSTKIQWNTSAGNASFSSNGDTTVTVAKSELIGPWTNGTAIDASSADLTINPADKASATVGGGVTALSYQESSGVGVDDGAVDFVYSASSSGTITLRNLPASTTFRAATTGGTDLGSVTTDGSGTGTISVSSGTDQAVVLFTPRAPSIEDTNPPDGTELSQSSVTLSVNASDADFATRQGDTVDVIFYVDGSQVGTDQLTSNGTASTSATISDGGSHTWHAEVDDNYGESVSTQTFDISVPSTLYIRSEENPSQLINATDVRITAYYDPDKVQRRTITDGTANLTGFPVDKPIIVRVNATNHTTRTAVVENIYEQNSVYLLNQTVPQYLIRFQLQQLTGDYPDDNTVLFVERDIELNGTVEWRTVAGDQFGVRGVPLYLKQDERYRLRIKNLETTQTAVIGAYTPVQSETVTVSAGSAKINITDSERTYGWNVTKNESTNQILVGYEDTENQTQSLKITIHERFNDSNVLVDNATYTNTNNLIYAVPMTANQTNLTWTAELYIDRGDGYMNFRVPIGGGPESILPEDLDSVWLSAAGVFIMLISALAFSRLNVGVGAVSTALVGAMLWWLGLLSTVAIGPGIVAALAVAVIYHYQTQQGGIT